MSAPDWLDVERALDLALELPRDDWPAFLDDHCAGNPALRREVESLLRASETPDTLLDRSPRIQGMDLLESAAAELDSDGFGPGDRIDRYEVVRLLGRGGQGSVYLAERSDGVFDKQVAIKVVKRGMVTEDVLARFRDERQILADLEHPNIAGILDGGVTADGLPYLVMELAEGEPLDDHCDRKRLSIPQRLALFVTVCEAVHYAHRNLVLHRDLKPGNILVTSDGQVKLLDFGIARVMESTGSGFEAHQTQAVIPRLTPEYAAPEQVMGLAMTTATDVYSLGVVLYELVAGLRPYDVPSRSLMAVQRVVCEVDPSAPSRAVDDARHRDPEEADEIAAARDATPVGLRDALRGDLDAIVMKALEKEPEDRYQSALELIRDIRRHFDGRTVEARPFTRWYRTSKFIRRNTLPVALGGAAVLVLVAGLATTTWQWSEARRQNVLREAAADRAEAARSFMVGVFQAFDPDELQGREMTPAVLIDRGLSDVRSLEGRPDLQRAVLNSLGQIALRLAETERADSIFAAALALPVRDTADAALDLAESLRGYGEILRNRLESGESVRLLRRALELQADQLAEDDPRRAITMVDLAFSLYTLETDADSIAEEARALLTGAAEFDLPPLEEARRLQILGDLTLSAGDTDEAQRVYRASLDIIERSRGSGHAEFARTLLGLGLAQRMAREWDEAEETYRRAYRLFEANYGSDHVFVARGASGLVGTLMAKGEYAEAAAIAVRASDALDLQESSERRLYAELRYRGAQALQGDGRPGRALALLEELTARIDIDEYGDAGSSIRMLLAELLLEADRPADAIETLAALTENELASLEARGLQGRLAVLLDRAREATAGRSR